MEQIFTAVEYCHRLQIVHRDLKPENIVFTGESLDSTLKVIDFGRSKILEPKSKITDKAGTVFLFGTGSFTTSPPKSSSTTRTTKSATCGVAASSCTS